MFNISCCSHSAYPIKLGSACYNLNCYVMCIGVRQKNGKSPLDLALEMLFEKESFFDIANYLIKSGCHGDEIGEELLCGACRWGKLEIVKELVKQLKVDPIGKYLQY